MRLATAESTPASVLQLPLRDVSHMFNAPGVDPLSNGLPEALGISGAEYLLQQLEVRRRVPVTTVEVHLPKDKLTSDLSGRMELALKRYAECRIPQQEALVRETRHHGWRLTAIAILFLAFFLGLSTLFQSEWTEWMRPLIRKTFEYGFEIVGWVMLWYPLEVLVFQPIAIKSRIKALHRFVKLQVVCKPT